MSEEEFENEERRYIGNIELQHDVDTRDTFKILTIYKDGIEYYVEKISIEYNVNEYYDTLIKKYIRQELRDEKIKKIIEKDGKL